VTRKLARVPAPLQSAVFEIGLSRHVFREMAHQCLLPGVTKSSW
jgi:small subunit ribosomal protein S14